MNRKETCTRTIKYDFIHMQHIVYYYTFKKNVFSMGVSVILILFKRETFLSWDLTLIKKLKMRKENPIFDST